ncbi:TPA: hypothetical protein ACH3X1_010056 [Trebouxia sp. C0004]
MAEFECHEQKETVTRGDGKSTPRRAPLGCPKLLETTGAHDWTVTGWSLPRKVTFAALQTKVSRQLRREGACRRAGVAICCDHRVTTARVCALAGDPQRRPTKAEQPLFDGSPVNEDDLGAAELGAICAAARKHVSCGGNNCGENEELADLNGDIDMEQDAVDTTPEEA